MLWVVAVPDEVSVRRRVGDAGDAGLHHQLGAIVELHPHLSTRQLERQHNHTHTHRSTIGTTYTLTAE